MADVVVTNDVDTFLKSANQAAMRTNIGAGTIATQDANNVSITGGSVAGITDLAIVDGGTGASTAAAARTNLEVYSDAEVDAKVATKAVAGGVAWTTGTAAGNAVIDFGTADFSLSGVVALSDYTPSAAITFFKSHSTGNNTVQLQLQTDGDWRLIFTDNGGTAANYDLVPSALTNNNAYQFVVTADRDGNAQLYIDGATSGSAVSISAESAVDIGSGNTNAYQIASVRNDFRIFNRALSAAEVADLYESGTVAVADRWGDGAEGDTYTSDFSVNTDGFSALGTVLTGNIDSIGGEDDNLRVVANSSTGFKGTQKAGFLLQGNTYKVEYDVYLLGTNTEIVEVGFIDPGSVNADSEASSRTALTDQWVSLERNITNLNSSATFTITGIDSSGSTFSFTAASDGDTFYVRNVRITRKGCIADLPLDEGIGYQFHDRSSNHFDALASTTGVTHLVPKQTGKVRVKAANASSAMYMLRADSILPTDSIISNVLSEQCYVDLTNSAQTLDDYRIRLNPSLIDLQIQRSDGSNHQTLGTVTAPASLSNVDVEVQYKQVIR